MEWNRIWPGIVLAVALVSPGHADDLTGDAAAGETVYDQTCIACHGDDGSGVIPGAPDFTEAEGVLVADDSVLLDHILRGFESPGSLMPMPAKGGNDALTIRDIRNVLTYLHDHFHYRTHHGRYND